MDTKTIALTSLFAIIITIQKIIMPPIWDKVLSIVIQVTVLSFSYFQLGSKGPIMTGFISGLLTGIIRSNYAWMTFTFSSLYGILIALFHEKLGTIEQGEPQRKPVILSSGLSSIIIGLASAYTAIVLKLFPPNKFLILIILLLGIIQGIIGGIMSINFWKKYHHIFPSNI
jgi:hypothetical protein